MFKTRKKLILLVLTVVISLTALLIYTGVEATEVEITEGSGSLLILTDYKYNPEKAAKDGVKGYIEVKLDEGDTIISRSKTEDNLFNLTITFISYDPDIKYATLKIDPQNTSHRKYQMEKGNIICVINDYIKYSEKEIILESGKNYQIIMYLDIPDNTLKAKIYITPTLGMDSDYPIISEDTVKIDE